MLRSREGLMGREMAFVVALIFREWPKNFNPQMSVSGMVAETCRVCLLFACYHPPHTISNYIDQRDMAVTIFFKDASQNVYCLCGLNHN